MRHHWPPHLAVRGVASTYLEGSRVVLVGRDVLNTYGATVRAVIVRRTEPPERWVVRLEGSGVELAVLPEQVADLRRCRP